MRSEIYFVYILVATTSVLCFVLGVRRFGLQARMLRHAVAEITECVGASVVFFGINAAIGLVAIFVMRGFVRFFSLYTISNVVLIFLSALQGVLFQRWWRLTRDAQGTTGERVRTVPRPARR